MTDDATFDRAMIAELRAVLGDAGADRVVSAFLDSLATRDRKSTRLNSSHT